MKQKTSLTAIFLLVCIFISGQAFAQKSKDWELEKWPVDLETDFALSALPAHLRDSATVYLLDPTKGYSVARKGTNGFSCFVSRTEWEWADFSKDHAAPMGYDAEGSRTIVPVFFDAAAMRATGKFTAIQVRDSIINGIKKGRYQAPSRTGISYMLAPIMRTYPGKKVMVSMHLPHYMIYAPYLTNEDIGGLPGSSHPSMLSPSEMFLDKGKGPFNYIIFTAGETETARIIDENKNLLKRLSDYKPYLKVETKDSHH